LDGIDESRIPGDTCIKKLRQRYPTCTFTYCLKGKSLATRDICGGITNTRCKLNRGNFRADISHFYTPDVNKNARAPHNVWVQL